MKNSLLRWLIIFFVSALSINLRAQGSAFTYQGRLNGVSGPASGSYDFVFTLYDSASGGIVLKGPKTNSAVAVSNGLFTATIDFGAAVFDGSGRWLEIAVSTNGAGAFFTLSPRQAFTPTPYSISAATITGPVPAAQITGTIPSSAVAGAYNNQVTLNNANNQFSGSYSGNGAAVTNVNAVALNGLGASNFWKLGGNNVGSGQFIGTTNNQPVEIRANNQTALLISPTGISANMQGGWQYNTIDSGAQGSVIAGGGTANYIGLAYGNRVSADYSSISGGMGNSIAANAEMSIIGSGWRNSIGVNSARSVIDGGVLNAVTNGIYGVVGGGLQNVASNDYATVTGGNQNLAGSYGSVGGGGFNRAGQYATVPGGSYNAATGFASFAAGYNASATNDGAFVWSDGQGPTFGSTGTFQYLVHAVGGVGINTNNPNGSALNVNGAVTATSFNGNGSGLNNLNAAQLSGSVPSAGLNGTYTNVLTLNNAANSFTGNSLLVSGNKTGGWPSPVATFNNASTAANASPALRVTASGTTADGALNVSSSGNGLIARFGNAVSFVADITTNGTVDAAAFSGNGSALTGLNASQITSGTLPNAQLSGTYTGAVTFTNLLDNFSGNFNVTGIGNLRLNDRPVYFRSGGDLNHGLAYNGANITNFGTGNLQVDGPVLWGFSGGALAVQNGGPHAPLTWDSSGVKVTGTANITGDVNVKGSITASNTPAVSYTQVSETNISFGPESIFSIASVTNVVSTPGYLIVSAYVNFDYGTNSGVELFLSGPGLESYLPYVDGVANPATGLTMSWVTPVNPTGTSNYVHLLHGATGSNGVQMVSYSLNAVYVPRLGN